MDEQVVKGLEADIKRKEAEYFELDKKKKEVRTSIIKIKKALSLVSDKTKVD